MIAKTGQSETPAATIRSAQTRGDKLAYGSNEALAQRIRRDAALYGALIEKKSIRLE